jgi:hypothetical protein
LNPLNIYIGVGIEEHPKYKFVVVIIFASSVQVKRVPRLSKNTESGMYEFEGKARPIPLNGSMVNIS